MKKFLLLIIILSVTTVKAQSFKGIGIFGALTQSAHYYENLDTDKKSDSVYVPKYFYPQSHISKEFFNWGAGLFLNFRTVTMCAGKPNSNTPTKAQRKGPSSTPLPEKEKAIFAPTNYTYIQWNNYLKFYNPLGYAAHWYLMPGIRLEYLFKNNGSSFPPVSGDFPRFWFSGDIGLGYEFPLFKRSAPLWNITGTRTSSATNTTTRR